MVAYGLPLSLAQGLLVLPQWMDSVPWLSPRRGSLVYWPWFQCFGSCFPIHVLKPHHQCDSVREWVFLGCYWVVQVGSYEGAPERHLALPPGKLESTTSPAWTPDVLVFHFLTSRTIQNKILLFINYQAYILNFIFLREGLMRTRQVPNAV